MGSPVKTTGQLIEQLRILRGANAEDVADAISSGLIAESEERLRILFEGAPDGCYLNDLRGIIVDGNSAAEAIVGYERHELIGKNLFRVGLLKVADLPRAAVTLARNVLGLATGPDEFTLRRKNGTEVVVEVKTYPVRISGQRLVLAIARDVTELQRIKAALLDAQRRLSEQVDKDGPSFDGVERLREEIGERISMTDALQESEDRYRRLVEMSPDAIVVSVGNCIVYANPAAAVLLGAESGQALAGESPDRLVPASWRPLLERDASGLPEGTTLFGPAVQRLVRPDGTFLNVEMSGAPITYGGELAALIVIRDITDRRRTERLILEATERERRRIGRDLHDGLGQQLTGVAFLAKTLADRLSPSGSAEARDAERITGLVNEAIGLTGRMAHGLNPIAPDADDLFSALAELAAATERVYGITCHTRLVGRLPVELKETTNQLYHIAQEAVANAVKHAHPTEIELELISASEEGITLRVSDDGVGIRDALGNPGMGLRIMQHRARMIDATLVVESGLAGGTVVRCVIPVRGVG